MSNESSGFGTHRRPAARFVHATISQMGWDGIGKKKQSHQKLDPNEVILNTCLIRDHAKKKLFVIFLLENGV